MTRLLRPIQKAHRRLSTSAQVAPLPTSVVEKFEAAGTFSSKRGLCEQYGAVETWHKADPPQGVVSPRSTEDVRNLLRVCNEHKVPLIPWGAGTSLEGHLCALRGGVVMDLSKMDKILEVNEMDMDCRVQPGVTRKQLNEHLRYSGLFFPVDPGADATIGGMAATAASGTTTLKYGNMRTNVLGVEAVTANGDVIRAGGRAGRGDRAPAPALPRPRAHHGRGVRLSRG